MPPKYAATDLIEFSSTLFIKAGLAPERAAVLAEVFLEADLMGFSTHGMNRVPHNLRWLVDGESRAEGEPVVLADRGNLFNWDADFLPGPWVLRRALDTAMARVPEHGVVTATLRRSQHIACLAAYLPRVVEAGYAVLLTCSTPAENTTSAFGGVNPVFSNNPIALGAPGEDVPLLFDMSTAITAGGYVIRAQREGRRMPEACLKDARGNITDDPAALEQGGSIMPIGGAHHGYKGTALSIMTEVLSMALGGYGRADAESAGDGEANSVFLQVIDPAAFTTLAVFKAQLAALQHLVEGSRAREGEPPARFPGRRAWELRERQLAEGVALYPSLMEDLEPWAQRFGVRIPSAM